MKNLYVISGVTGMTGNELARQLLNDGHTVIGFDNFFASSIDTVRDIVDYGNFYFFEYDLNNAVHMSEIASWVEKIQKNYSKTIYVNCAAVVHTEHFYEVEHTFTTNVTSMRSFLQQAISVHADIYINCSTSEVYSMQSWNECGGVKEDDFLLLATAEHSQRTSYAVGKLLTEFFMKDAVDKGMIKGCSIRFANVYSNHERFAKHIIPHIIDSLSKTGEVILLENSKKNKRSFLHNIDSCRAVLELINSNSALDGTVYNVATDEEISIVDLAKLIAEKLHISMPRITFEGYRASDPERRILNTDKIRKCTNWKPVVSLSEGLDMCIQSLSESI
ncbi:NAD-dependent epimerase/dehydratase family protein [Bacteroides clarus]|uniref:NAD-dependent epimerase/dehydratase family protein n=1 Tax=Bacteroides clarus TaxID=626929 RepID=UPI00248F293B|nr:NAD(P)-dependent oxidoreductase [Bacteroides clarus]